MMKYVLGVGVLIGVVLLLVLNPFTTVGTGERGVVLDFGAFNGKILSPGMNMIMPIKQDVVTMNVQTQKEETQANAASKDLQAVSAVVALNYHLDPSKVGEIYQDVGLDYAGRIISPSIMEAVKASTAKFTAEELITRRQEVKEQIKVLLAGRLSQKHIIVEDVAIVDFDFSASFNEAIEAKVTAEQQALAAKNKLEQVKFEAQQKIETAKAEAESIRIQAQALAQNQELVKLKAVEKWNGILPTTMLPGGSVPFLNIGN